MVDGIKNFQSENRRSIRLGTPLGREKSRRKRRKRTSTQLERFLFTTRRDAGGLQLPPSRRAPQAQSPNPSFSCKPNLHGPRPPRPRHLPLLQPSTALHVARPLHHHPHLVRRSPSSRCTANISAATSERWTAIPPWSGCIVTSLARRFGRSLAICRPSCLRG